MKEKYVVAIIVASIAALGTIVASLVARPDETTIINTPLSSIDIVSLPTNNTLSIHNENTNDDSSIYTSSSLYQPIDVVLDTNGGNIFTDTITVCLDGRYPKLEDPSRDYYTFKGWYTSKDGGYKVEEGDIVNNPNVHTLYAHWIENPIQEEESSKVPFDAKIEEVKWTYTLTETQESTNPYEPGWTQTGCYWKKTETGNHIYANFPSNYDGKEYYNITDPFYNTYNNSAYTAFETETSKREITNEHVKSYIYYHWAYPLSGNHSETNRIIGEYKGKPIYNYEGVYYGTSDIWEAVEGGYVEYDFKHDAYVITGCSTYSYCWNGRIPVCIQSYTDYEKKYQYKREITMSSETEVTAGGNISSVKKHVKYRKK